MTAVEWQYTGTVIDPVAAIRDGDHDLARVRISGVSQHAFLSARPQWDLMRPLANWPR